MGQIRSGESPQLPAGLRVHRTGDRPDIVAADLRTHAPAHPRPGVATITATVQRPGATARATLVVLVR